MAGFKREQGTCTGRGFADTDAEGFCAKFKTWVQKSIANGGPGWYIIIDKSAQPVATTITAVDTVNNVVTAPNHGLIQGEPIQFYTTGTQMGNIASGTVYHADVATENTLRIRETGGRNAAIRSITSAGSGNTVIRSGPFIIISDKASPALQDTAKIGKIGFYTSVPAEVHVHWFLSRGVTGHHPVGLWSGRALKSVDSGPFTYDFRGGPEFMGIMTKVPGDSVWYVDCLDEWVPLDGFCEDDALVGGVVAEDAPYTPSTTLSPSPVVVKMASAEEAESFAVGQGYFIFHARPLPQAYAPNYSFCEITYGIVNAKGAAGGLASNEIRFSQVSGGVYSLNTIRAGARISPYYHRWYTFGTTSINNGSSGRPGFLSRNSSGSVSNGVSALPYVSYQGTLDRVANNDASIITGICNLNSDGLLGRGEQDNGLVPVMRGAIFEASHHNATSSTFNESMNRAYGETKNVFLSISTGLSIMEAGRTIGGKQHLYYEDSARLFGTISTTGGYAVLVRHSESEA